MNHRDRRLLRELERSSAFATYEQVVVSDLPPPVWAQIEALAKMAGATPEQVCAILISAPVNAQALSMPTPVLVGHGPQGKVGGGGDSLNVPPMPAVSPAMPPPRTDEPAAVTMGNPRKSTNWALESVLAFLLMASVVALMCVLACLLTEELIALLSSPNLLTKITLVSAIFLVGLPLVCWVGRQE